MTESIDQETIDTTVPPGKIYTDKVFWAAVFLGGPLAAGYLFAENFKTVGKPEKVKMTWIIAVLTTIAILGIAFSIPEDIYFPNQIIPLFYTAIGFMLFRQYQADDVAEHLSKGGEKRSWGNVVLVGLIGGAITILPIFAVVYSIESAAIENEVTRTYGSTVKNEITFDKTNVSEAEIDQIAQGFTTIGFFDLTDPVYVYVEKQGSTYEISISVNKTAENNPEAAAYFSEIRKLLDAQLPHRKVVLKLVVNSLDDVVKEFK